MASVGPSPYQVRQVSAYPTLDGATMNLALEAIGGRAGSVERMCFGATAHWTHDPCMLELDPLQYALGSLITRKADTGIPFTVDAVRRMAASDHERVA